METRSSCVSIMRVDSLRPRILPASRGASARGFVHMRDAFDCGTNHPADAGCSPGQNACCLSVSGLVSRMVLSLRPFASLRPCIKKTKWGMRRPGMERASPVNPGNCPWKRLPEFNTLREDVAFRQHDRRRNLVTPDVRMTVCRFILCLLPAVLLAAMTDRAAAGDWRFRRSYHTHQTPPQLQHRYPFPRSRSAYRPAYPSPLPGFSAQAGFRINRIQINSGQSSDTTIIQEGWFWFR